MQHPDIALTRLRHLATSEDETVCHAIIRALSSLAAQPGISNAATLEMTRWITSSQVARQRTGRAAFLRIAASSDIPERLTLLRPDDPLRKLAVIGWRAVLDERHGPPIDDRVTALAGWFEAALPDSPYREETFRILAAAAGDEPIRNLVLLDLSQFWVDQADNPENRERRLTRLSHFCG